MPIIAALAQSLAANQILSLQGILNGTSNFILTGMSEHGLSYAEALAEAQQRGYAEADPTLDVDGTDAAHKLAILAQIAFGVAVPLSAIERRGIADVDAARHPLCPRAGLHDQAAGRGLAARDDQLALHVSPVLLRRHDAAGPGARRLQRHLRRRRRRGRHAVLRPGSGADADRQRRGGRPHRPGRRPGSAARSRRCGSGRQRRRGCSCGRRPRCAAGSICGCWSRTGRACWPRLPACWREHQISIASVIQHEAPDETEGTRVQLVIMTHTAPTGAFRSAAADMDRLGCVAAPAVYYPVGD